LQRSSLSLGWYNLRDSHRDIQGPMSHANILNGLPRGPRGLTKGDGLHNGGRGTPQGTPGDSTRWPGDCTRGTTGLHKGNWGGPQGEPGDSTMGGWGTPQWEARGLHKGNQGIPPGGQGTPQRSQGTSKGSPGNFKKAGQGTRKLGPGYSKSGARRLQNRDGAASGTQGTRGPTDLEWRYARPQATLRRMVWPRRYHPRRRGTATSRLSAVARSPPSHSSVTTIICTHVGPT
jgi:hypothetical protein